ncbi:MAG: hypothetical protein KC549_17230, partial [Myxococcales bacterium]|nr:hypothetical protein [Myxococcales bacterium]
MHRLYLLVGAAGLTACIEDHAPATDDAGAPDVGADAWSPGDQDAWPPRDATQDAEQSRDAGLPPDARVRRDAEVEPDRGIDLPGDAEVPVDAALPEIPPYQCPPEGRYVFGVGACAWRWDDQQVEDGRVELMIEEAVMAEPPAACRAFDVDTPVLAIGRLPEGRVQTLQGISADGQRWSVAMALPRGVPVPLGGGFSIEISRQPNQFFQPSGIITVRDTRGLLAWIAAGDSRFPGFAADGLSVQRADPDCEYAEPDEGACTYTGYRIRAEAG